MVDDKRALRAALRAARRALPLAQRAREAAAAVAACAPLSAVEALASYAALPEELDLAPLHAARWQRGLAVYLPRVVARELVWHAVRDPAELRPGYRGIPEPDPDLPLCTLPPNCLVLVPGLGFTADGARLGQGGGYYDRLLAARPDLRSVGVGFSCQLLPALPQAAHDQRLGAVLIAGQWFPSDAVARLSAGRSAGTAAESAG
ncbi:MAG: 5-formyltetrahydrofolate cyclo-ligase [Planctomycetota bacterium]|nr:5-formyltetrahydrofolate cyclo-ligase [Planctomycetota bacterium]